MVRKIRPDNNSKQLIGKEALLRNQMSMRKLSIRFFKKGITDQSDLRIQERRGGIEQQEYKDNYWTQALDCNLRKYT